MSFRPGDRILYFGDVYLVLCPVGDLVAVKRLTFDNHRRRLDDRRALIGADLLAKHQVPWECFSPQPIAAIAQAYY